jgi:hypothetical protein
VTWHKKNGYQEKDNEKRSSGKAKGFVSSKKNNNRNEGEKKDTGKETLA